MKCTQKAEKKLFLEGDLFMDGGKRASVRNIVISVLLIVVGIAMLMLVIEGIKSGWYDAHSARPAKRKGYAALLPVLLVLLGGSEASVLITVKYRSSAYHNISSGSYLLFFRNNVLHPRNW